MDYSGASASFFHRACSCSSGSHLARAENERLSRQVRAGLLLLLGSCGWLTGGEKGAELALAKATARREDPAPKSSQAHLARRTLMPSDAPELFAEIETICWRAKLHRRPEICVLIGERSMNAFAFDNADAVITFTEGLLRGMTTKEAAAIFAHELAHICNGDGSTMSWAADLQRAINDVSAAGLAATPAYGAAKQDPSLRWLLERAPAVAELLMLALSRCREIEADAFALELTGDAKTLERALAKLEHHHRALSGIPDGYVEDRLASYLRSHPPTFERIGHLRASDLYAVS